MVWCRLCHVVGNEFCLVHDAVDAYNGILQRLGSTFDGHTLDITLAAVEEKTEYQREKHRDNQHDGEAET